MVSEQDIVGVCVFCEDNVSFFESHVSSPHYGQCWHFNCEVKEFSEPSSIWFGFKMDQVLECLMYLDDMGYSSVPEWAKDSDYEYNQEMGVWLDEYSNPVMIGRNLFYAMEQALYAGEGA
jgi:hypothetical protein